TATTAVVSTTVVVIVDVDIHVAIHVDVRVPIYVGVAIDIDLRRTTITLGIEYRSRQQDGDGQKGRDWTGSLHGISSFVGGLGMDFRYGNTVSIGGGLESEGVCTKRGRE